MNYEVETQWENDNHDVYIWLIKDLSSGEEWLFWYSHRPGEAAPFHRDSKFDDHHFELLKKILLQAQKIFFNQRRYTRRLLYEFLFLMEDNKNE